VAEVSLGEVIKQVDYAKYKRRERHFVQLRTCEKTCQKETSRVRMQCPASTISDNSDLEEDNRQSQGKLFMAIRC